MRLEKLGAAINIVCTCHPEHRHAAGRRLLLGLLGQPMRVILSERVRERVEESPHFRRRETRSSVALPPRWGPFDFAASEAAPLRVTGLCVIARFVGPKGPGLLRMTG